MGVRAGQCQHRNAPVATLARESAIARVREAAELRAWQRGAFSGGITGCGVIPAEYGIDLRFALARRYLGPAGRVPATRNGSSLVAG